MAKVFNPEGIELSPAELAKWANDIHKQSGAKGNPFSRHNFSQILPANRDSRLGGNMCYCGTDEKGYSKGEFKLLNKSHPDVVEGMKAYMFCYKCGGYSHL